MTYLINKKDRPIYLQIYRQIRDDIVKGMYPYNSKLPSKRLLAEESGVSTITIEHAYALLCDEGYAEPRERSGYFVIFRQTDGFAAHAILPEKQPHLRADPSSDHSMPVSVLSKTMRKVLNEYRDVLLEKSPNPGCTELQNAIKRYLARNRGIHVDSEQIIIGSGAEYLYWMIVNLLGREPVYAIETPSYEKIEQIYHAAGAKYERLSPFGGRDRQPCTFAVKC